MSITDEFDRRFGGRGGRFDLDTIDSDVDGIIRAGLEAVRQAASDSYEIGGITAPEVVYVDFIASYAVGATVTMASATTGLAGVYQGTVLVLYDLFLRMMATPSVCPEIGNARAEDHTVILDGLLYTNSQSLPQMTGKAWPSPNDPRRKTAAAALTLMALEGLIYHEIGHLANGHLTRAFDGVTFSHVDEDRNDAGGVDPIVSQVLEMEADRWASTMIVETLMHGRGVRVADSMRSTTEDLLRYRLFSLYCTLSLLAHDRNIPDNLSRASYPTPAMRQIYMISDLGEALKQHVPDGERDTLNQVCMQALADAENAIAAVSTTAVDTVKLMHAASESVQAHVTLLMDVSDKMRGSVASANLDQQHIDQDKSIN